MFKCEQCGQQTRKNQTQFKREKFRILKDFEKHKIGKEIIREKKVCYKCFKKYGAVIK